MKIFARLSRIGAIGVAVFALVAGGQTLKAQAAPAAAASAAPEELSQQELLKAYQQVREQLQATQQAIAANRVETEAAARTQSAALTERLDAIKTALEAERERYRLDREWANAERERQQAAAERANAERDRRQAETAHANQTLLWIAAAFGSLGLLAMLLTPLLQWRAINRMAALTASLRPQLMGADRPALPGTEVNALSDKVVGLANQRLMSALDRMEQRIFELEHTSGQSPAEAPAHRIHVTPPPRKASAAVEDDKHEWIAVLLNKGQTFLHANKAIEALACYDEILKLDLNHPEALVKRGAALERLKQDEEAIQCYDRAIKVDRKMTLAYLHKGSVCNRLERYEEALRCYEQALRVEEEMKANS